MANSFILSIVIPQQLHNIAMSLSSCQFGWRLATVGPRVNICAGLYQHLNELRG
jgi:hypothetical protein